MLELWDVTRKNWQASTTHTNLHKTNTRWLVHSWSTFGARTSQGQLKLTRLTTSRTWGKPSPSPLYYIVRLSTGAISKWLFVPGLPSGSPEIPTIRTLITLGAHNFAWKLQIIMSLSRAFQWHVACYLQAKKSGQFLTFSGRESNCQFDSRPFFWS
jgi:hypothetical protein